MNKLLSALRSSLRLGIGGGRGGRDSSGSGRSASLPDSEALGIGGDRKGSMESSKEEVFILSFFLEWIRPRLRSSLRLGIGGGRGGRDSSGSGSLSDSKALSRFPVRFVVSKLELGDPV